MRVQCPNCGGAHPRWECPEPSVEPAVAAFEAKARRSAARAVAADHITGKPSPGRARTHAAALVAPPGVCAYCDRRRAYAAAGMRRSRAKKKKRSR